MRKSDVLARLEAHPDEFVELSEVERFGDGSGYHATLRVAAGSMACSGHSFYFDGFEEFVRDLRRGYQELEGAIVLGSRYEHDFVKLEFTVLGHVIVTGVIVDHAPPRLRLEFGFKTDQTACPDFLRALERIVEQHRS